MTKGELIKRISDSLEISFDLGEFKNEEEVSTDYNKETGQLVLETESGDFFDITINKR